jgi:hypothetical protein
MDVDRRTLIVGAGAALAAPAAAGAATRRPVGIAREGRDALEVIGTIVQEGLSLTGFGWLMHVAGLEDEDLFTDPAARGAATARLRWHCEATVTARDFLPSLFSASGEGPMRITFADGGGADPESPATFATGQVVARYGLRFHNVLTVVAPDQAVTEITGELVQRTAPRFSIGGAQRRLGRPKLLQRLTANGPGTRSEPTIPRATFHVAGGIVVPD